MARLSDFHSYGRGSVLLQTKKKNGTQIQRQAASAGPVNRQQSERKKN
jgi:hypothetical protein